MHIGKLHIADRYHRYLYLASLAFVLFSLPFYRAMSSIGLIVMAVNWIFEGHFAEKRARLKKNPGVWLLASFYFTGILGAIYSEDMRQVVQHLQNGLAFLAAPLIIGTSKPLLKKELQIISSALIISIFINSLVSYSLFLGVLEANINNFRQYSFFSSNVHLSYNAIVGVLVLYYYITRYRTEIAYSKKWMIILIMIWMIGYIYFLRSFSGIITLTIVVWTVLLFRSSKLNLYAQIPVVILLLAAPALPVYIFQKIYQENFTEYEVNISSLPDTTSKGNPYKHKRNVPMMENGHYVGLYQSETELKEAWENRSELDYRGKDRKGQPVYMTLIRYMTAKGLKKDAEGLAKMSKKDIKNVEKGITNPLYASPVSFYYPRFYTLAQAVFLYQKTGKPFDSVTKRLEAYQAMISIFKENPLIGAGNGDIKQAYAEYFNKKFENAEKMSLVGGHNQYLKVLATFGILGFTWFLAAFFGSWFIQSGHRHFLTRMIFVIFLLAMVSEVPLDQQRPAILFSVFLSLFLFRNPISQQENTSL
ncbi:MAG TPA: O-antigen ligase family protein [Bacteroidales bacterium]|nr:O-antigen ligase family protein [Bacteroidales bacterium]